VVAGHDLFDRFGGAVGHQDLRAGDETRRHAYCFFRYTSFGCPCDESCADCAEDDAVGCSQCSARATNCGVYGQVAGIDGFPGGSLLGGIAARASGRADDHTPNNRAPAAGGFYTDGGGAAEETPVARTSTTRKTATPAAAESQPTR